MSDPFVVTPTCDQALQKLDHQSQKRVGLSVQDFQKDLMLMNSKSGDRLHAPSPQEHPRPFELLDSKTLEHLSIPESLWSCIRTLPEPQLPEIMDHLSEDATDALIRMCSGEKPPEERSVVGMPTRVADGQIEGALDSDFQTWMVFLHPAQERLGQSRPSSSMRITGGPGNRKTVVALHRSKGLEFRAVVIASAGKSHIPFPVTMREAQDAADRNRISDMERPLLYVGITRATEQLLITCSGPFSPFLSFAVTPQP